MWYRKQTAVSVPRFSEFSDCPFFREDDRYALCNISDSRNRIMYGK